MSWRRLALVAAVSVLLADFLAQSWINGHTVNLVVVNASGTPVEISWQPAPGAPTAFEEDPGCASHSLPISAVRRGELRGTATRSSTRRRLVCPFSHRS